MDINRLIVKARRFVSTNSPTILTVVGVAGTFTTAVLTTKATFKAADILSREPNLYPEPAEQNRPKTTKEKVIRVWTLYVPPAACVLATSGAIVFAHRINMQRMAAMAGMYTITEKAYSEYRDKIAEKLGFEEEQKVREELMTDKANRTSIPEAYLADPLTGYQLMHEAMTGRYFWSTKAAVMNAVNEIYEYINHSDYAMIEEFYDKVGLEKTSISDEMGWNGEHPIELLFQAVEHKDGRTALSFEYKNMPILRPDQFGKDARPKAQAFR